MITLLDTGVATLGVVDLPEGATKITVSLLSHNLSWYSEEKNTWAYKYGMLSRTEIKLPPGNWIILGWSDELTEEQAKVLVQYKKMNVDSISEEDQQNWYYDKPNGKFVPTALRAIKNILLSNGITERKFLIKKAI